MMKIRTKLLLALGGISLIPPIAAYVTLINNPRISFALRMNKYEAQQGLTAQRLQADLQAIGSAVEESLNETYRIKVEPKERADAERQRGLANSAVQFNDMFGHDAGDTVLRELGDYLAKFIRRGDLACRYGGEEFTLILPESSLEDTRRRAEELRTSFRQLSIKHRDIVLGKVTLSLGVAALPDNGTTAVELLAAADGALLKAKEEGRDRVLIADVASNRAG